MTRADYRKEEWRNSAILNGFYNKIAKKSRLFFRFFSFYLVKPVRTVRMAKVAHS